MDTELGLEALRRGDATAAAQHLERACQSDPQDAQARLLLGIAYGECGRAQEGVRVLRSAAEMQPDSAPAYYNLSVALERGGQEGDGQAARERARALDADYVEQREALERERARGDAATLGTAPALPGAAPRAPAGSPPPPTAAPAPGLIVPPVPLAAAILGVQSGPVPFEHSANRSIGEASPCAASSSERAASAAQGAPAPQSPPGPRYAWPPPGPVAPGRRAPGAPPGTAPRPASGSTQVWIWVLAAFFGTSLVVLAAIGSLLYAGAQRASREAERGRTTLGRLVNEPEWGIGYSLPYGMPAPQREQEPIQEGRVSALHLALTSQQLLRSCLADVLYFPGGVADDRPPRQVLKEVCEEGFQAMSARVISVRDVELEGHAGLDYQLEITVEGDWAYCRMRALHDPHRIIRFWYISGLKSGLDAPVIDVYFNSLRIGPTSLR